MPVENYNTHIRRWTEKYKMQIPETVKLEYPTSRTCEIYLSLHSGISYKSIAYLVNQAGVPVTDNSSS